MTVRIFLFFLSFVYFGLNAQVTPLLQAHSHNDYDRKRPLKDALSHGFTSVEADILYIYGKLYVGHNMPDSRHHQLKTLSKQYLRPLYKRFKKNGGYIYEGYEGDFYLWIDIKFEPRKAYQELRRRLYPIRDMLNYYENGRFHKGKVTVILSGERPFKELLEDSLQLMTLDGRPEDLAKNYPSTLMPFISENAGKVCEVEHYGQVGPREILKVRGFVERAKSQGKKTRLWATPEDEKLWDELRRCGLDLINTDDLPRLNKYLLSTQQ